MTALSQEGFEVMDPEYINIMITGDARDLCRDLQEILSHSNIQDIAKKAGAEGFHVVECISDKGKRDDRNNERELLKTGAVDLVISEVNSDILELRALCKLRHIPQICISQMEESFRVESIPYDREKREAIAAIVIAEAVTSYITGRQIQL